MIVFNAKRLFVTKMVPFVGAIAHPHCATLLHRRYDRLVDGAIGSYLRASLEQTLFAEYFALIGAGKAASNSIISWPVGVERGSEPPRNFRRSSELFCLTFCLIVPTKRIFNASDLVCLIEIKQIQSMKYENKLFSKQWEVIQPHSGHRQTMVKMHTNSLCRSFLTRLLMDSSPRRNASKKQVYLACILACFAVPRKTISARHAAWLHLASFTSFCHLCLLLPAHTRRHN